MRFDLSLWANRSRLILLVHGGVVTRVSRVAVIDEGASFAQVRARGSVIPSNTFEESFLPFAISLLLHLSHNGGEFSAALNGNSH